LVENECSRRTVMRNVSVWKNIPSGKVKRCKQRRPDTVTPNMVRRMVLLLAVSKAHHSF